MRVFLAGEGKAELGDWSCHPSYRREPPEIGILEAILRRVRAQGWSVAGALCWKNIRKYRAHGRISAEVANVLGLILRAREGGCEVVAFSRDRDRDCDRERDVHVGIEQARALIPDCPAIIGGMAVEAIESWVAALQGKKRAESSADPCRLLDKHGLDHMRSVVEDADLSKLPSDAQSLRRWLSEAAQAFGVGSDTLFSSS